MLKVTLQTQMMSKKKPEHRRTSSPLSNRISSTSNLDNVELDDVAPKKAEGKTMSEPSCIVDQPKPSIESQSPADKETPNRALSLTSITNALPAMPWSPPAETPLKSPGPAMNAVASPPPQPHPGPPTRKLTSPFSWLSRSASKEKDISSSVPAQGNGRRNTASSVGTLSGNPEMMLSKLEEEHEGDRGANGTHRESLRDRFKALRMREEAGIQVIPGDGEGQANALGLIAHGDDNVQSDKSQSCPVPIADHNLAPGTVSGISTGPSAMQETPVDWDLWQSVVNEGPAAVARTSPEELNRAIATGIPSAIRGVIWQVLAQSKNEHLETIYQELVTKGTDKEKRNSGSTTSSSAGNGVNARESER